jgi:hypothetical protein
VFLVSGLRHDTSHIYGRLMPHVLLCARHWKDHFKSDLRSNQDHASQKGSKIIFCLKSPLFDGHFWIFFPDFQSQLLCDSKVLFFYTDICLTFELLLLLTSIPSSSARNCDVYLYIAISI